MKKTSTLLLLLTVTLFFTTSCATIVTKSSYPISFNSSPSEANIVITGKKGVEVYRGNTPATMKLRAGSGFFSKAHYQVRFEKKEYDTKIVPVNLNWMAGILEISCLEGQ